MLQETPPYPNAQANTLRIILLALMAGPALFCIIAVFSGPTVPPDEQEAMIALALRGAWLFLTITGVAAIMIFPAMVARQHRKNHPEEAEPGHAAVGAFLSSSVIGAAMLEAPAILIGVVILLYGSPVDLLLAVIPLIIMSTLLRIEPRWQGFVRLIRESHAGTP